MKLIQVTMKGSASKLIVESLEEAHGVLFGDDLDGAEVGDEYEFKIIEMDEVKFSRLGDFDGF